MVASERFSDIITALAAMSFDYILIDSPAFMSVGDATALATSVDGIILLRQHEQDAAPDPRGGPGLPGSAAGAEARCDHDRRPSVGDERYHYYAGRD